MSTPVREMVFTVPSRSSSLSGESYQYVVTKVAGGRFWAREKQFGYSLRGSTEFFERVATVISTPAPVVKGASTSKSFTQASVKALHAKAHEAGHAAATAASPVPMIVGSPSTPLGSDIDPSKPTYFEAEGVCGFAWVETKGTTSFARQAVKAGIFRKSYSGGVSLWVSGYGQSMQRKEAYADAYAEVLSKSGVSAYAGSRMD